MLDKVALRGVDIDGVGPGTGGTNPGTWRQHLDIDSTSLVCPNHDLAYRDCGTVDGSRSTLYVRNDPDSSPTILSPGNSSR